MDSPMQGFINIKNDGNLTLLELDFTLLKKVQTSRLLMLWSVLWSSECGGYSPNSSIPGKGSGTST